MTKLDIVTYTPTLQGNPVNRYRRNNMELPIFKGTYKKIKGHVFDVRSALAIDIFSIMMREMTEIIGHIYKKSCNVKKCLDRMKGIALPKPKPEMGDDGVTPS